MNDEKNKESLSDEFRNLGENLAQTLHSIWESPERKKLQNEIEEGLAAVAETVKKESESFKQSETGQRLKSDFEDLRQRVNSGEVEGKVREELLKTLRFFNAELQKITGKQPEESSSGEDPGSVDSQEI
ncbi:MAG TPA: hypothetical protein VLA49_18030 [Anaerolineales bacterium]|nr:hypothetical protein [Anaerolineales bacterium]